MVNAYSNDKKICLKQNKVINNVKNTTYQFIVNVNWPIYYLIHMPHPSIIKNWVFLLIRVEFWKSYNKISQKAILVTTTQNTKRTMLYRGAKQWQTETCKIV